MLMLLTSADKLRGLSERASHRMGWGEHGGRVAVGKAWAHIGRARGRCCERPREAGEGVHRTSGCIRSQAARRAEAAVTGCACSVVNLRWCDMVRVAEGWCGTSVEAWNGRRGQGVMTGPVCEECEQAQQRCRRQTSAPDDKSRPVSLASGRRARGCPRTCGTRCRSSATARSSNRAAIGRQCAKEGPGLVVFIDDRAIYF
jgi:hypothetical protein